MIELYNCFLIGRKRKVNFEISTLDVITADYLSNRPRVSMDYRLLLVEHEKSVLPTSQVVYQPINHKTCGLLLF